MTRHKKAKVMIMMTTMSIIIIIINNNNNITGAKVMWEAKRQRMEVCICMHMHTTMLIKAMLMTSTAMWKGKTQQCMLSIKTRSIGKSGFEAMYSRTSRHCSMRVMMSMWLLTCMHMRITMSAM